jgi:hypothetical protein
MSSKKMTEEEIEYECPPPLRERLGLQSGDTGGGAKRRGLLSKARNICYPSGAHSSSEIGGTTSGRGLLSKARNICHPCGDTSAVTSTQYRSKLWANPTSSEHFITLQEAVNSVQGREVRNFVILPPDNGDGDVATDEDDLSGDDDNLLEPAGEVEVDKEDSYSTSSTEEDNGNELIPRWRKECHFLNPLPEMPCDNLEEKFPELQAMS